MIQESSRKESIASDKGSVLSFEGLSQGAAHSLVGKLQQECFPDLFGPSGHFPGYQVYEGMGAFAVSAPNSLFSENLPLITPAMVTNLQRGATLLSVGAGPAYGEQLLVRALGVSNASVHLTDITSKPMPESFTTHEFDMYAPWPNLGEKYDYIIFRNSTFLNGEPDVLRQAGELSHLIASSLNTLAAEGQVRMNVFVSEETIYRAKKMLKTSQNEIDFSVLPWSGGDKAIVVTNAAK